MARKINNGRPPRKTRTSVAMIVGGKDEAIYINQAKKYYSAVCPTLAAKIKPELPTEKKVGELFAYAQELLSKEYTHVILILDFDDPLGKKAEFKQFEKYYGWYQKVRDGQTKLTPKQQENYGWMSRLTLVVNNPCLEYWYLLHFAKSNVTKFYGRYEPELERDVRRLPGFAKYDKSKAFCEKTPDIFTRLGGLKGLAHARSFKQEFDLATCREQGVSEMKKVFDFFDTIGAE